MATATSASARVFGTPELVEHILLCLPLKDLLFSQRVCRGWQSIWAGSVGIQRALFLQPVRGLEVSDSDSAILKRGQRDGSIFWITAAGVRLTHRPLLNPFLGRFIENPQGDSRPQYLFYGGNGRTANARDEEGTRDQMLITQPAARYPVLSIYGPPFNSVCEHMAAAPGSTGPGVRVAEVKRLCRAHRARCMAKWYRLMACEWVEIEHVEMLRDGLLYTGHEILAELEGRCEIEGS